MANRIHEVVYLNLDHRIDKACALELSFTNKGFPMPRRRSGIYWKDFGTDPERMLVHASDWAWPVIKNFAMKEQSSFRREGEIIASWQMLEVVGEIWYNVPDGEYVYFALDDCFPTQSYRRFQNLVNYFHPFDMLFPYSYPIGDQTTYYKDYHGEHYVGSGTYPEMCHGLGNGEHAIIMSKKGCELYKEWQLEHFETFECVLRRKILQGNAFDSKSYHVSSEPKYHDKWTYAEFNECDL